MNSPDSGTQLEQPLWLRNVNSSTLFGIGDIAESVGSLLDQFAAHGLEALDRDLARIRVEGASVHHAVAVLRTLFAHRKSLRNWRPLEQALREEMLRRGLNAERTLVGLNKD